MQQEQVCPRCSYRTTMPVAALCPACDVPLVLQERTWAATRRAQRTTLQPSLGGQIDGRFEATVLDLSILGARLEHGEPLRTGWRYLLSLPVGRNGLPLQLLARVVWTRLDRYDRGSGRAPIYQSGVEFRDVPREVEQGLAAFLGGIHGTRHGPLPGTVTVPRNSPA